jgi:flagellar biosynthetic protein FliQ
VLKAVTTMTPDSVVEVGRQAIETLLLVSGPMLGLSLVVGLLVSIMQTMTQVNEATLTFVPKILAVFLGILLFLPWMMSVLISFMTGIWTSIPQFGH